MVRPLFFYNRAIRLNLPKEYIGELGIMPGDKVDITLEGNKIIITKHTEHEENT